MQYTCNAQGEGEEFLQESVEVKNVDVSCAITYEPASHAHNSSAADEEENVRRT